MINFGGNVRLVCLAATTFCIVGGPRLVLAVAVPASSSVTIEPCLVGIRIAGREQRGRKVWAVGRPGASVNDGEFNQADAHQSRYFCSYLGLAYAKPPVGELRFEVKFLLVLDSRRMAASISNPFNHFPQVIEFIYLMMHICADPYLMHSFATGARSRSKQEPIIDNFPFHARHVIVQPPQLVAPDWTGKKHFTAEASPCLQLAGLKIGESTIVGSEDCLYLNVHTTSIRSRRTASDAPVPSSGHTPSNATPTSASPTPPSSTFLLSPAPPHPPPSSSVSPLKATADFLAAVERSRDNGISNINLVKTSAKTEKLSNPLPSPAVAATSTTVPPPRSPIPRLKPVLVWLHGGSFNMGSASSDTNGTDYIVAEDVLVVTVNYRLGALGFMAVPAANITGNYGLHDQQMALAWVRRYIRAFGGDPKRITLMGWSAGAASVGLHILAESSRGLFKRAIMMSGSPINPWAFNAVSHKCSSALLAQIPINRINNNNNNEQIEEVHSSALKKTLQQLDTHFFVRDVIQHTPFRFFGNLEFCFVPTVDANLSPLTPEQSLAAANIANAVPLLIGSTSLETESDFPMGFEWENAYLPNNDTELPRVIDNYLRAQLKAPFDEGDWRESRRVGFLGELRRIADINYGVWKFAEDYGNSTGKRVFVYRFSFDGRLGGFKRQWSGEAKASGAMHGDDLGYLFGDMRRQHLELDMRDERLVRERMVSMWTNFVKFGNPTPRRHSALPSSVVPFKWPPFNDGRTMLDINSNLSRLPLSNLTNRAEYQLWDVIYHCLYAFDCTQLYAKYLQRNWQILSMK